MTHNAESVAAVDPNPAPKCDHICLKDDGHVERGEPHFYGYELPSPREEIERLRAYLARILAESHHWCTKGQVTDHGYLKCSCDKDARDTMIREALRLIDGSQEGRTDG